MWMTMPSFPHAIRSKRLWVTSPSSFWGSQGVCWSELKLRYAVGGVVARAWLHLSASEPGFYTPWQCWAHQCLQRHTVGSDYSSNFLCCPCHCPLRYLVQYVVQLTPLITAQVSGLGRLLPTWAPGHSLSSDKNTKLDLELISPSDQTQC